MLRKLWLAVAVLVVSISVVSCEKKPVNPVLPGNGQFPAQPRNLTITFGDRQNTLRWLCEDSSMVGFYRIYRRDSTAHAFAVIDTTKIQRYVDRELSNNVAYFYQVSAVSVKGYERIRSEIV